MSSPQAVGLRSRRSDRQLLEAAVQSQRGIQVLGPRIVTANGVCCDERQGGVVLRQIQNCSIVPVKYLIDNDNNCDANNFHGILAACSAVDDGLGSVLQMSITSQRISIFGVGGNPRVSVLEIITDFV